MTGRTEYTTVVLENAELRGSSNPQKCTYRSLDWMDVEPHYTEDGQLWLRGQAMHLGQKGSIQRESRWPAGSWLRVEQSEFVPGEDEGEEA